MYDNSNNYSHDTTHNDMTSSYHENDTPTHTMASPRATPSPRTTNTHNNNYDNNSRNDSDYTGPLPDAVAADAVAATRARITRLRAEGRLPTSPAADSVNTHGNNNNNNSNSSGGGVSGGGAATRSTGPAGVHGWAPLKTMSAYKAKLGMMQGNGDGNGVVNSSGGGRGSSGGVINSKSGGVSAVAMVSMSPAVGATKSSVV